MSHYFDNEPTVRSDRRTVEVVVPGDAFDYETDTGVFSHGRLDPGTKILLSDAPPPASEGNLLDIGCGAGPIALSLARRSPAAHVWAVDVNERALDLVRSNATRLGLTNIIATRPEDVPTDVVFETIWSNPPIKVGKEELHSILGHWLPRLSPTGTAVLVVNKHLGSDSLARWLTDHGHQVRRLGSRRGYRLLAVGRAG
jgi:16S rRNA (guanine1207-N2)-methyltransferase